MRFRASKALLQTFRSLAAGVAIFVLLQSPAQAATDWSVFQRAFQTNGVELPSNILRFPLVRRDLGTSVAGLRVSPALLASGFISVTPATVIPLHPAATQGIQQVAQPGDAIFFAAGAIPSEDWNADRVARALRTCSCINIASMMNHAAKNSPNLIWVHFEGTGTATQLSAALAGALAIVHKPQLGVSSGAIDLSSYVPPQYLALYQQGTMEYLDDTFVYTLPRPEQSLIAIGIVPALPAFGIAQSVAIQAPNDDADTLIFNVELALRGDEVQPVSDALRAGGFQIAAQGIHYMDDNVRLYFVHAYVRPRDPAAAEAALANALSLIHAHDQ
ncbi:MAG: DUF1259 domain-containing protein [Acidobacteriaceae bacterium]